MEDEPALRETLECNLTHQGYEVATAADGLQGLELARGVQPHLMALDLMLWKLDGLEVCRTLRQETSLPIIVLTARTDEVDRVMGLELGADDYLSR